MHAEPEQRNYKAEVKEFVLSNLMFGVNGKLQDDTSFMESGAVDSTGVLEIIVFLETNYDIKIDPEETIPQNLDSINQISNFLTRKLGKLSNQ